LAKRGKNKKFADINDPCQQGGNHRRKGGSHQVAKVIKKRKKSNDVGSTGLFAEEKVGSQEKRKLSILEGKK